MARMSDMLNTPHIKVIHVRASNFFGGPEKQIVRHLSLLRDSDIDSVVCSFHEAGKEAELVSRSRELGLTSLSVPCSNAYDPRQISRLRSIFIRQRPQVVCTHDYRSNFLSRLAKTGLGAAHVAFWRGTTRENLKVRLFQWAERPLLKAADRVVVVSREQRDLLISSGFSEKKVAVVHNAVDVGSVVGRHPDSESASREWTALLGRFSGKTIIASVGRLSPEKGHEHLIRAVSTVHGNRPDVVLLIIGEGPLRRELTGLVRELGSGEFVHLLGLVPDFASFAGRIDLFVLPSVSEGLPNALLEAMAAARPVVATSVGGVPEVVTDGKSGLLVSPGNSDEMAGAMLRVLSDSELAGKLGLQGREAVRESFSFERQCGLLVDVYSGVVSRQ